MATGDVTILGPYTFDATSMTAADTAITTARVANNDKWNVISSGTNWWMIHIEEG
mgnify:CR=1 FL=1